MQLTGWENANNMRNAKCTGTQTSMEWPYCSFLYCACVCKKSHNISTIICDTYTAVCVIAGVTLLVNGKVKRNLSKWEYLNGLNIQIFRNVLFLTFQNIKPGKPALYQSLLLPAEQNYLHMTGIVSHDSSDDDDHEFWEIFLIRDNKKKIKTFTFGRYQQRWLWNNVQVEEPEAMFRSKKQICFSQVSEGRYGEVVCCTESTRTIQSRANIKELFQRVWKLRRYC